MDYIEVKSLFRSLGIELALKEGDQESEEFIEILNTINPSIEGAVTKDEFINYMINRETTQVKVRVSNYLAHIMGPITPNYIADIHKSYGILTYR